jgi:uncharacterized RDD family membrane protein YckC
VTRGAPTGSSADPAAVPPRRRATFARRIAALGYEALLLVAMAFVAGFLFLPFLPRSANHETLSVPSPLARAAMFCALVAGAAFYYTWCWSGGRQTLPQKTWRLRLVDRRGQPLRRGRALIRYAAFWIGPALALVGYGVLHPSGHGRQALAFAALNYCWAIVDRDRQFLHDRLSRTVIVQDL